MLFSSCSLPRRPSRQPINTLSSVEIAPFALSFSRPETVTFLALTGRKGSGKTTLVYTAAIGSWMQATVRREMMLPCLRIEAIKLSRQILAHALSTGEFEIGDQTEGIQRAVHELFTALHPHHVDVACLVYLKENGVLEPLFKASEMREGFMNASLILNSFPVILATPGAVPSHDHMKWMNPPSVAALDMCINNMRILDGPGPEFERGQEEPLIPDVLFHHKLHSKICPVFVVGLHAIESRMHIEDVLISQAYAQACEEGHVEQFGVVFTQIDVWKHGTMTLLKQIAERLFEVATRDISPSSRVPFRVCVVNALDPLSVSVCLQEFKKCEASNGKPQFLEHGISRHGTKTILWGRSVFGGINCRQFVSSRLFHYQPRYFGLLNKEIQLQVQTVYLCAKRKESGLLHHVPQSVLDYIVAFFVTFN